MSTLQDYSGNRHTAIPYTGGTGGTIAGTFDGISCVFDAASSQYLQIPATVASAVSGISSFTFATWIKVPTVRGHIARGIYVCDIYVCIYIVYVYACIYDI
jgi:hypothetical protein